MTTTFVITTTIHSTIKWVAHINYESRKNRPVTNKAGSSIPSMDSLWCRKTCFCTVKPSSTNILKRTEAPRLQRMVKGREKQKKQIDLLYCPGDHSMAERNIWIGQKVSHSFSPHSCARWFLLGIGLCFTNIHVENDLLLCKCPQIIMEEKASHEKKKRLQLYT